MELHTDFSQRVILHTEQMPWLPSPAAGVERRQLDRQGEEVARATSIVRYASGSFFAAHPLGGGEEIFVLEGVFSDEHGHYPTGSYCVIHPEPLTPLSQSRAASSSSSSGSSIPVMHKPSVNKPNRAAGGLDVRKAFRYSFFMNFKVSELC